MSSTVGIAWPPTHVTRVVKMLETSTAPLLVATDAGPAYAKVLGNPEGPAALVCEYLGTRLAAWLGLPVFDIAIVDFPSDACIELARGCVAQPGPAFASRQVAGGRVWDGTGDDLDLLDNPEAITDLVVFDTWLRNRDRYWQRADETRRNVRNVFLSDEGASRGQYKLLAIDHTESIRQGRELGPQLSIGEQQESAVYGLFPEFLPRVTRERTQVVAAKLRSLDPAIVKGAVGEIPRAWLASEDIRTKLVQFCVQRATYVGANVEKWLEAECKWQTTLLFE